MSTIVIISIILILLGILLFWNKYALQYNHNILKKSRCKNCNGILGIESVENAKKELEKEKAQLKRIENLGKVKLHNMKLICPKCSTENFEHDLYQANRKK